MRLIAKNSLWVALVALFGAGAVLAQVEDLGGPYTKDANTILLMHFDGNLVNEADFSADGVGQGSYNFVSNAALGLGQCIRFDNDAISDSSYVWVADTSYLDLTGDWTLEGWINVFTYGETSGDHRWVPRLMIKTGDEVFWRPNYWIELWGDNRFFSSGYHTVTQDAWPQVNTPNNFATPGQWVHITFIRDTGRHLLISMIHDQTRQLLDFNAVDYLTFNAADPTPITTGKPLHIGFAGGGGDSWLDGFIDEVRISNIVRNFAVPPLITEVTEVVNQPVSATSYEVSANIDAFSATGTIASATIRFNDGTGWTDVSMSSVGDTYTGSIPQRPLGTIIDYYIVAVDNFGSRATYPAAAEFTEPDYLTFGVYAPNTLTFHVTFEEGPGNIPVDHSSYNADIVTFRVPDYSTDAKEGTFSLLLVNAPTGEIDSNWVEVNSPFLSGEGFSVDFWLNADSAKHATRIINLPRVESEWNQNNYEVSFRNGPPTNTPVITGRYWTDDGGGRFVILQDTTPVALGAWYHVTFERDATTNVLALAVRDGNDQLLFGKSLVDAGPPVTGGAPLRVGRAQTSAGDYWFIPPFRGKLDDVKVYNYPASGLTPVGDKYGNGLPGRFELLQNYPNPFNPATSIRFAVPSRQAVQLVIYDLLGRKVKTLLDEEVEAGEHAVSWDGSNESGRIVASGLYVYRMRTDKFVEVRKMMLLR